MHPTLLSVTRHIQARSQNRRTAYLAHMQAQAQYRVNRTLLDCGNLAHGFAACSPSDKQRIRLMQSANLGIITAYNDVLSAHQPYEKDAQLIRQTAHALGSTAQVASGVPAMCDGVTQGQPGMELSLFSRDSIAQATAIGLTHHLFDAALYLGVCDKIVPGLFIAAARFGFLPAVFIPAGPMTSGIANKDKARIRQQFAAGLVDRETLLAAEAASYHAPGTCTFYGTANSNQLMMEIMGLHLPSASFVNAQTPLRHALTQYATERAIKNSAPSGEYLPFSTQIDERAIVNALVGLLASGGSTNHSIHLIAMAAAAGITLTWDDFNELSAVVPTLLHIYPNGKGDVNHFHAAGGTSVLFQNLLSLGLLHGDIPTIMGLPLAESCQLEPFLINEALHWRQGLTQSLDTEVLAAPKNPFAHTGGLVLLKGNLGRAIIKVSAVKAEFRVIEAPVRIFTSQEDFKLAFKRHELDRDVIVVVRFQGPRANGMPELHKLTPYLGTLLDQGFRVALITDGRMSGASGKIPAAIHVTPEALQNGPLGKLRDHDVVRLDSIKGELMALVDPSIWDAREQAQIDLSTYQFGFGRELFSGMRQLVSGAEEGASSLGSFENLLLGETTNLAT